jgi:HTH-type transcriptional regulator / antitoxin HipB
VSILNKRKGDKMKTINDARTFNELLDIKYGKPGTKARDNFEIKAKSFVIGQMIKEASKEAHLTQDDLAKRTGTGFCHLDKVDGPAGQRSNCHGIIKQCASQLKGSPEGGEFISVEGKQVGHSLLSSLS